MKSPLLVLGCGSIGRRHVGNLVSLGEKNIDVYDRDAKRSASVAREFGVTPRRTLGEAWRENPEAVLVCTPTNSHRSLAREALSRDCHVFVEKPLSHQWRGVDSLIALSRKKERVLMVGYNLRFNACAMKVKEWLDQGRLGAVLSARLHVGSYLPWRHPWEDYRRGYGARSRLGGGVILDSIHEIDCALWFFGPLVSVYCVGGKFSSLDIDTEDVAEILLTTSHRKVVSVHLDYLQRPHERWCEVIGEAGYLRCDYKKGVARLFNGETRRWTTWRDRDDPNRPYLKEMAHFLRCIRGRGKPGIDGESARQSLGIALAAKASARRGARIDVSGLFSMKRSKRQPPL